MMYILLYIYLDKKNELRKKINNKGNWSIW